MTSLAATLVLCGLVGLGLAAALGTAAGFDRLAVPAAGLGWLAMVGGAVALYAGFEAFEPAPVSASFAMAAAAALVVLPASGGGEGRHRTAAVASALAAGTLLIAAVWFTRRFEPGPWREGALLIGVHWSALGAAAASGLAGALFGGVWTVRAFFGSEESSPGLGLRARARDAAARCVALLWIAWPVAALIHWRYLGAPGLGTRSEWFGLGITLVATGALLVGWDLADNRSARFRSVLAPGLVGAIVVAGILVSIGYGSPFALSLGA